ncbi:matrix metalloproteinase-11 [Ensifer sp. NBAIM29]|nr:matrix metalloproteinase-11 [Ensifer sp. NBAIM29]
MAQSTTKRKTTAKAVSNGPFALRKPDEAALKPHVHVIREGIRCDTERRGFETPRNRSRLEIVVDASEGFIPLWSVNTTLRWRFQERSFQSFRDPNAAKAAIEELLGEAILRWGDAAPVKFARRDDAWDFEIVVREADDCNISGCVLASAFFPDAGQHELTIYPKMFAQDREEQVETLIHEIGHIFGLRHFFALVSETAWPAEVFGNHNQFSIMNYGENSKLTANDTADLKNLYQQAWAGNLTHINGTPIKFVRPFHLSGETPDGLVAVAAVKTPQYRPEVRPE